MTSIGTFQKKSIKSCETVDITDKKRSEEGLSEDQLKEFENWFLNNLSGKISSVIATNRLKNTPLIISNPESSAMRMMRKLNNQNDALAPQKVEINANHPIILKLFKAKDYDPTLAKTVAEQIFNNALISAGLLDDPKDILSNLNNLIQLSMNNVDISEFDVSEKSEK
jgi:TNF receptor-associated protein 1